MMQLPPDAQVSVGKLAQAFNHTNKSYKFYWLLAIVEEVQEQQDGAISMERLVFRMVEAVWYPLDYFRLSFGMQDRFREIADFVNACTQIDHSANAPDVGKQLRVKLSEREQKELYRKVMQLLRYVPYRLLRPFFSEELRGINNPERIIRSMASEHFDTHKPFYHFRDDSIVLHPGWKAYFLRNMSIVKGFIFWHLQQYLQRNNPNVIGLSEKLFKPGTRNFTLASRFWKHYLNIRGGVHCIYSGEPMHERYAIDHFIPWRYAVHDKLWNLVPAIPEVNASKSDSLPDLEHYLEAFTAMQYDAFHAIYAARMKGREKLLEDYVQLFQDDLKGIAATGRTGFQAVIAAAIRPMEQIARNTGFQANWKY